MTITDTWSRCHEYRGCEVEYDVDVEAEYEPGEKAIRYGDMACAGSDSEVEITSVHYDGTDITDELSGAEMDRLCEYLRERHEETARDAREAAAEDAADARRDR